MKVAVTLVIEVDPKDWAEVYGSDKDEVRQDIKTYVQTQVQESAGMRDTEATVTVR